MPILAMSAGKVTAIWGSAYVRSPDGSMRALQVGDKVAGGERIITDDNGLVQISPIKGPAVLVKAAPAPVDKAIVGIESQDPDQAPAAGLTGGADGGMQPGLRVDRVVETVGQLSFDFGTSDRVVAVPLASSNVKNGVVLNDVPPQAPPQVSINSVVVNESAQTALFTVTLDKPSTSVVTVSFATEAGSALAASDFNATTGTVTFQPGVTSQTIAVPLVNDAIHEWSEQFTVKLSDATNSTIQSGTGTVDIRDDDQPYLLVQSGESTVEGGFVVFDVTLTRAAAGPVTVKLTLASGLDEAATPENESATLGVDTGTQLEMLSADGQWVPLSADGQVTFEQGQTLIQVRVATVDDQLVEDIEFIKLQAAVVSGETMNLTHANQTAITDNDQPYMLVQSGEPAVEGAPVVFDVVLTHAAAGPVTVKLALASGVDDLTTLENESATLGVDTGTTLEVLNANGQWDPVGADGLVTFEQGQTLIQVRVATVDDQLAEDIEFIKLQATVVSGDTVNQTHANQTAITDNDVIPGVLEPIHAQVSALDTNLMIMLDTSGSMNEPSGMAGMTRLEAAIKAIGNLIDRYDQYGDVAVRIVTFASEAHIQGDAWMTAYQAKDLLASLQAVGSTNYDYALADAQTAFQSSAGKLGNAQNVAYFLSHGNPTLSSAYPNPGNGQSGNLTDVKKGDGIDATEESGWIQFLNDNQIKSYAVGMGSVVGKSYLDPVAYDGHASSNSDGVVVSGFSQLDAVLTGTTLDFVEGNLSSQGSIGLPGCDFQRVASITVDGVVHAYNPAQTVLTLSTALGGELTMDMQTGHYSYAAPTSLVGGLALESFAFSLLTTQGQLASSTLDVRIDHTQVQVGSDAIGDAMTGGATADLIMGRDGADVVSADGGNDLIYGNGGDDELHGGAGDDRVVGGQGSDVMFGDAGSDVFVWRFSDHGASASVADRAVDIVKDFDVASNAEMGDVLDLRDLLQGENTTGGAGNLEHYLSIDTSGADTVIRVSPTGELAGGNPGTETQGLVLEGVNLRADMGLDAAATSQQVIARMLEQGKLLVDQV